MKLSVLYEDNHLLAVDKPAGVPTMGAAPGVESMVDHAKHYLAEKYNKPGAVYLGVVSRLDAPVSGVLLLARTSKAAARLTEAFRQRQVEKTYLAAVEGQPDPADQHLVHYLRKDERQKRMHTTHADAPDAKRAELTFETVEHHPQHSVLKIELGTGRKHQIRVQLAKIGHPILGDTRYGGPEGFPVGIALHARQLQLEHPVRREPLEVTAPLPASWHRLTTASRRHV